MDSGVTESFILTCKHGSESVLFKLPCDTCYEEFMQLVRANWPKLTNVDFSLDYSVPGHDHCLLRNREDYSCMLLYVSAYGLRVVHINVITQPFATCGSVNTEVDNSVLSGIEMVSGEGSSIDDYTECNVFEEPSNNRPLLSSGWKHCIRHVNQQFKGGVIEFRAALIKYTLERGFTFKFSKNTRESVIAFCQNKKTQGCKWSVSASICRANNFFIVRRFFNIHSCDATVQRDKGKRLSSKVIASLITDALRDERKEWDANDVASHMLKNYGYDIKYDRAWHALNKANEKLYGSYSDSYQQLMWYTRAASALNPGSHIVLDVDEASRKFRRLFIAWGACIDGFRFVRPMLFIDGTHLKGKYRGCLLSATGKNANQELYPLAYAVVDAENQENWLWFLQHLRDVTGVDRRITFVSDRNSGLLDALPKSFPDCDHFFCLMHLKDNLRTKFSSMPYKGFKERIVHLFSLCAHARTPAAFNKCMAEFLDEGGEAARKFVEGLPLQNWTNAFSPGNRYGEMTSNAAESFNAWIVGSRSLPITQMVDQIRTKLMGWFVNRKTEAGMWTGLLCKDMEKQLRDYAELGRTWNVKRSTDYVFEVLSDFTYRVDFTRRTCSCMKWQLTGFPCAHAVRCINRSELRLRMTDYIEHYWYASTYRRSYEKAIEPIPTSDQSSYMDLNDPPIYPPRTKRPPGRPKKKRYMSKGEKSKRKLVRCSRCSTLGHHNKKSCTAPI